MMQNNSMKDIQHFIWDFDGTLFDTYPVIIGDLRCALQEYGKDLDPVKTMELMLINIPTARDYYADLYGIDRQELDAAYQRHHKKSVETMKSAPMADVEKVLAAICESGRHNYIFTHRKVVETDEYLNKYGMAHYFREVVGPESPRFAWKPAPDAVLYLMERYGMTKENAVMIGDRDCDLASGRNAGVGSVHLICPIWPETLNCDWRLDDFAQMLEIL